MCLLEHNGIQVERLVEIENFSAFKRGIHPLNVMGSDPEGV